MDTGLSGRIRRLSKPFHDHFLSQGSHGCRGFASRLLFLWRFRSRRLWRCWAVIVLFICLPFPRGCWTRGSARCSPLRSRSFHKWKVGDEGWGRGQLLAERGARLAFCSAQGRNELPDESIDEERAIWSIDVARGDDDVVFVQHDGARRAF